MFSKTKQSKQATWCFTPSQPLRFIRVMNTTEECCHFVPSSRVVGDTKAGSVAKVLKTSWAKPFLLFIGKSKRTNWLYPGESDAHVSLKMCKQLFPDLWFPFWKQQQRLAVISTRHSLITHENSAQNTLFFPPVYTLPIFSKIHFFTNKIQQVSNWILMSCQPQRVTSGQKIQQGWNTSHKHIAAFALTWTRHMDYKHLQQMTTET